MNEIPKSGKKTWRRGPKKNRDVVRTFSSAVARLGCNASYLKRVRDAGCDGFDPNGRIDTGKIRAWMQNHPDLLPPVVDPRDGLWIEKLREAKRRNDHAEGILVERAAVAEQLQKVFRPALARVEQMLVNEYPSKVSGLDVPAARVYGKRVLDALLEAFREAALQWE